VRLEWSKDAVEDLDYIWEYIALDNVDRAFTFIDELRSEAYRLIENPLMGIKIPELNNINFREWFYKGYTFIYEIEQGRLIIHEVHSQKRYFIRSITRDETEN